MLIPLLPYLFVLPKYLSMNSHVLNFEIWLIFFSNRFFIGQIILYIGLAVLIVAGIQWIWYHHKNERFFTRGLYSRIRHPQFTGIILITLGLTIVVLIQQSLDLTLIGTRHKLAYLEVPLYVGLWFLQVLGYVVIARFEEWRLLKKFDGYKEYRSKVPFLFPLKSPKKIPELRFTILLIMAICLILLILPYNFLRLFFYQHIPPLFPST